MSVIDLRNHIETTEFGSNASILSDGIFSYIYVENMLLSPYIENIVRKHDCFSFITESATYLLDTQPKVYKITHKCYLNLREQLP